MKDALSRAQSLYKRERWRLALEILESHLTKKSLAKLALEEQVQCLDLLSALSEKQGLTKKSRTYATHIVRKYESDIRGYLRLGKLLQLERDKLPEALSVYKRALLKVNPMPDKYRDFLHRQISHVQSRIESTPIETNSRYDFFQYMPIEIKRMIFQELTLKERVKCCMVCKSWQTYLYSEPLFWCDLVFTGQARVKYCSVGPDTLVKYCSRSKSRKLNIDMQSVLVKDPKNLLNEVSTSLSDRVISFQVNPFDPVAMKPLIRWFSGGMPNLEVLKICSDIPTRDIRWCLANLPNLRSLDIVLHMPTTDHTHSTLDKVISTKLESISILGVSSIKTMSDMFVSALVSLPSLRRIDLHRVVGYYWPCMAAALANPSLNRLGFTSNNVHGRDMVSPMPRFCSQIRELALNDLAMSKLHPLLLPDGMRWMGYIVGPEPTKDMSYLELKRVTFPDVNLADLLNSWGCFNLETLVLSAVSYPDTSFLHTETENTDVFLNLSVLQYTNMGTISTKRLEWIISTFPNVRKLNLDGTTVSGPQLVQILKSLKFLRALRCNTVTDTSADTIRWAKGLPEVTVIF